MATRSLVPSASQPSLSQLDIHAKNYVPLWLRAVNDSVASVRFCSPLPSISYASYIGDFAGTKFLSPIEPKALPPISKVPFIKSAFSSQLTRDDYFDYFYECLQNEIAKQADDLSKMTLFNSSYVYDPAIEKCYRIKIPGLREHAPRIELGDIVFFRHLLQTPNSHQLAQYWYTPGGGKDRGLLASGFTGKEYHAVVYGLSRAQEEVILRIDELDHYAMGNCILNFIVQEHRVNLLWRSVTSIATELRAWPRQEVKTDWIGPMLFPDQNDSILQTTLSKGVFDLVWYDDVLNYEQKKAVDAIVSNEYGTVPYLISGPPGTGKTKTLVETVLQLLDHPPENVIPHLLICAPSDPAADTITRRLSKHLKQTALFRLNNWTRSSAEVPGDVLPFTFMQDSTSSSGNLFSLPEFSKMMQYKVVVTTCHDADMLVQARLTNRDLTELALGMLFKISPTSVIDINPTLHWTALLVDEAAQATEPEALIPLSVVSTTCSSSNPSHDNKSFVPQFVMIGDEHQLGPHLALKSSSLSSSLFQRLFARQFYADHLLSRINGSKPLTSKLLPLPRPAFTNLIRNYRSHPAILATSSVLFYADTLIPEFPNRSIISEQYPYWKPPYNWPLVYVQISFEDSLEDILSSTSSGSGLYNRGEAHACLAITSQLLQARSSYLGDQYTKYLANHKNDDLGRYTRPDDLLHPKDIAIIVPFRAQVKHVRELFRSKGLSDVNIGPLEAFQGLESRVVILCTTRTRLGKPSDPNGGIARFVHEDIAANRGIIGQKQKFNVAMTRAMEALFVIGDERALTCTGDECWTQFLSFVGRNNTLRFDPENDGEKRFREQMSKWNGRVGRLEAALRFGVEIGDEKGRANLGPDEVEGAIETKTGHYFRGMTISEDDRMLSDGIKAEYSLKRSALSTPSSEQSSQPRSGSANAMSESHTSRRGTPKIIRPPPGIPHRSDDAMGLYDRDPVEEIEKAERSDCVTQ